MDPHLPNPNLKPKDLLTVEQLKVLSPGDVVEVLWEDKENSMCSTWYQCQVKKVTICMTLTLTLNAFLLPPSHQPNDEAH